MPPWKAGPARRWERTDLRPGQQRHRKPIVSRQIWFLRSRQRELDSNDSDVKCTSTSPLASIDDGGSSPSQSASSLAVSTAALLSLSGKNPLPANILTCTLFSAATSRSSLGHRIDAATPCQPLSSLRATRATPVTPPFVPQHLPSDHLSYLLWCTFSYLVKFPFFQHPVSQMSRGRDLFALGGVV